MYMYPVLTSNPSELSPANTNSTSTIAATTTTMPRNRSASTASATSPPPPALITRGFQSLRRAHRRLSNSSPSSPIPSAAAASSQENNVQDAQQQQQQQATDMTSPTRPSAESADSGNGNNNSSSLVRPRMRLVPNVGISSRSFVFEIIDRELEPGVIYRIGRFSDRNAQADRLSFKSKVVSRNHAELWTETGKVFIRDIGSSSGTFLNRIRLSPPSHISQPHEVRDGDAIQLGVDYQGGLEPIYRAVRIRVELNRQTQNANSPFTRTAFQQLRSHLIGTNIPSSAGSSPQQQQPSQAASPFNNTNNNSDLLVQPADLGLHREPTKVHEHSNDLVADVSNQVQLSEMMSRMPTDMSRADIQECCICLYAIAPFQALFLAPCSHIFHFKCLRPIVFQNYPGFSCPLCRSYFDLEASVAVEVDEVLDAINAAKGLKEKQQQQSPKQSSISPIDTVPELNEEEEDDDEGEAQEEQQEEERVHSDGDEHHLDTAEGSLRPSSSIQSDLSSDIEEGQPTSAAAAAEEDVVVKTRLEAPSSANDNAATPPVPFISIPEDEVAPSSSSSAQAINVNSQHSQNSFSGRTASRGGEGLLSTTLVGSPIFDTNVLPTTTDSNA